MKFEEQEIKFENSENIDSEGNEKPSKGKLFIISTPIGNNDDFTIRGLNLLKMSDMVICEELKIGAHTLKIAKLNKELIALNEQTEEKEIGNVINLLKNGKRLALISDAGTPVFADPGLELVRAAIRAGIEIEVAPGASSIMAALVRSTFNIDKFFFAGFLSRKSDERLEEMKQLLNFPYTIVLLETPYRLLPFLEAANQIMPNRKVYIGMNLTMIFETHHYGTFAELYDKFSNEKVKSEFIVVIEGNANTHKATLENVRDGLNSTSYKDDGKFSKDSRDNRDSRDSRSRNNFERGDRNERGVRDGKYGEKKFGEKKFGEKKFGEKRFGDNKFGDKKYGDKPRFEDRRSSRPNDRSNERPYTRDENGEKQSIVRENRDENENRGYDRDRRGGGDFRDNSRDSRDGFRSDRRDNDRKPFGEKKFGEKKFGEKKFGEKKFGEKRFGDKPFGEKKFGEKKFGEKKFGDKPFREKRNDFGDKPKFDKPFGDKPYNDKPKSDKPFSDKPKKKVYRKKDND